MDHMLNKKATSRIWRSSKRARLCRQYRPRATTCYWTMINSKQRKRSASKQRNIDIWYLPRSWLPGTHEGDMQSIMEASRAARSTKPPTLIHKWISHNSHNNHLTNFKTRTSCSRNMSRTLIPTRLLQIHHISWARTSITRTILIRELLG